MVRKESNQTKFRPLDKSAQSKTNFLISQPVGAQMNGLNETVLLSTQNKRLKQMDNLMLVNDVYMPWRLVYYMYFCLLLQLTENVTRDAECY